MAERMRDGRDVTIVRIQYDYVGLGSFLVLLVLAAIIGVFIWQPWNAGGTRFMTVTTQTERATGP